MEESMLHPVSALAPGSVKLGWLPREQSGCRLFWARHVAPVFVKSPAAPRTALPATIAESTKFIVDSIALVGQRERETWSRPEGTVIPFETLDWPSAPIEPGGYSLQFVRDEKTGEVGANLVREFGVNTPFDPCQSGYETEEMLAEVLNPELLIETGWFARAELADRLYRAFLAFRLDSSSVEEMRQVMLERAAARIAAERASIDPAVPRELVVEWEQKSVGIVRQNFYCDLQNHGLLESHVRESRKLVLKLAGVSIDEAEALLAHHRLNMDWGGLRNDLEEELPAEQRYEREAEQSFRNLNIPEDTDPIVRAAFKRGASL